MLKKKCSLNKKILFYFLCFSFFILLFLWLFQVIFLESFYKYQKTNEIKSIASEIKKAQNDNDFFNVIDKISFDNEACIEIRNSDSSIYTSVFFGKGCIRNNSDKNKYINYFINSGLDDLIFNIKNTYTNSDTILYGVKLFENSYAFINTSIEPIDSTSKILAKQLIIVSIIVLILSFVGAFFISKRLSNPITSLNAQTKNIANGNFDLEFTDNSNILEISELTDTLNYTRSELGKTEELRRDLMANVSHDLKTPLTMIKAYAEMGMDLHSNNKKKREEDLKIITSEVDRLTLLVNDILDLSKIQAKTLTPNMERFDIVELTSEIINRYAIYQSTENYKFVFNHDLDSIKIYADKKMIEQVIYNLINNAINYTGKDNLVVISITVNNDSVLFTVTDSGCGIKDEDIPYIWDRYYKNNKKHKRNLIGTGLGLSIVKNILDLHKFNYGVDSKINVGSTFYFEAKKRD